MTVYVVWFVCWELLFNAQGICSTKLNSNSVDYKPPLRITDPIEQLKHRPLWDRLSFIFIYRTKSKVWRYPEINKMNSSRRNSDSSADGIINYRNVLNSATYIINLQHNLCRVLFLLKYKIGCWLCYSASLQLLSSRYLSNLWIL